MDDTAHPQGSPRRASTPPRAVDIWGENEGNVSASSPSPERQNSAPMRTMERRRSQGTEELHSAFGFDAMPVSPVYEDPVESMRFLDELFKPMIPDPESVVQAQAASSSSPAVQKRQRGISRLDRPYTRNTDQLPVVSYSGQMLHVCNAAQVSPQGLRRIVSHSTIPDLFATISHSQEAENFALPTILPMPIVERCEFCIKFDSVCSSCHFKWKANLQTKEKALLAEYASLPEVTRMSIFMVTVAHGSTEFLSAILASPATNLGWPANLQPPQREKQRLKSSFGSGGRAFALHVACAYDRIDNASILLDHCGSIRRTEGGKWPFDWILDPPMEMSISDDWDNMLQSKPLYVQYKTIERARSLRAEGSYEDAETEYREVLNANPASEGANCGLAKMYFDMKAYGRCIAQCDIILNPQTAVNWVEFCAETIRSLRQQAITQMHVECHEQAGPALKECGCIITDKTVISLRRIPFSIIKRFIMPFCPAAVLCEWYKAVRIPLLRGALIHVASHACDPSIGFLLASEFGYAEMYDAIRGEPPPKEDRNIGEFVDFVGLQVIAMGDFHTYIIQANIRCRNPRYVKSRSSSWFRGDRNSPIQRPVEGEFLRLTKQFRVSRADFGKAWEVFPVGEWELQIELLSK